MIVVRLDSIKLVNGVIRLRVVAFLSVSVFVSMCMMCEVHEAHTRNHAQCMCAAVVSDDARLPWLIVCVLVCALLLSPLCVYLSYEV